jgi:NAD(P)-dependent dehydrogenase (short-subunit alcohol dehydrogenase family)
MADQGAIVVVGGSTGIGHELARHYAEQDRTVYLTSRDQGRADEAAAAIGGDTHGIALDLTKPESIAEALSGIGTVDRTVLVAVLRDENTVREYNMKGAIELATMKLIGYTEVCHVLSDRMHDMSSILLFGGLAKERPYPGSTTVTTVNGAVATMIRTMAIELAPIRVNAIHPAVVGDSPYWMDKPPAVLDNLVARTPMGRLITTEDVVDACVFLLENKGMNAVNLNIDGGWLIT